MHHPPQSCFTFVLKHGGWSFRAHLWLPTGLHRLTSGMLKTRDITVFVCLDSSTTHQTHTAIRKSGQRVLSYLGRMRLQCSSDFRMSFHCLTKILFYFVFFIWSNFPAKGVNPASVDLFYHSLTLSTYWITEWWCCSSTFWCSGDTKVSASWEVTNCLELLACAEWDPLQLVMGCMIICFLLYFLFHFSFLLCQIYPLCFSSYWAVKLSGRQAG